MKFIRRQNLLAATLVCALTLLGAIASVNAADEEGYLLFGACTPL
jgi:hypothetical protein